VGVYVLSVDESLARGGPDKVGQKLQSGRLPGAVWTEKTDYLRAFDLKVEAGKGGE